MRSVQRMFRKSIIYRRIPYQLTNKFEANSPRCTGDNVRRHFQNLNRFLFRAGVINVNCESPMSFLGSKCTHTTNASETCKSMAVFAGWPMVYSKQSCGIGYKQARADDHWLGIWFNYSVDPTSGRDAKKHKLNTLNRERKHLKFCGWTLGACSVLTGWHSIQYSHIRLSRGNTKSQDSCWSGAHHILSY